VEIEAGLLQTVLVFAIKNALPMIGVYWILERPFILRYFNSIQGFVQDQLGISVSAVKRYVAILISILVSTGLYVALASLGYAVKPEDFEAWAGVIISVSMINYAGTQVIQSRDLKLR